MMWGFCSTCATPVAQLAWSDFVLGLVAFIGVSGFLPFTVDKVMRGIGTLVEKGVKGLEEKLMKSAESGDEK